MSKNKGSFSVCTNKHWFLFSDGMGIEINGFLGFEALYLMSKLCD